jgi:hypothetical protein
MVVGLQGFGGLRLEQRDLAASSDSSNSGNPEGVPTGRASPDPTVFMLGRVDAASGWVRWQAGSRWRCEALS